MSLHSCYFICCVTTEISFSFNLLSVFLNEVLFGSFWVYLAALWEILLTDFVLNSFPCFIL